MDTALTMELARQAIITAGILVMPVLLVALAVGCLMSLLQAVTQVQDGAISFVPKLLAVGTVLMVGMPWMSETLVDYARELILQIPSSVFGG